MPERKPPSVSNKTPIGPDVDLDRDDIRLADGTPLTPEVADDLAAEIRRNARRAASSPASEQLLLGDVIDDLVRDLKSLAKWAIRHLAGALSRQRTGVWRRFA